MFSARKRMTALLLLLSSVLAMAGCQKIKPLDIAVDPSGSDSPVFMLEQLPDIGDYVDDTLYKRRYPEFRDTLTPGEDYGKLIPFVGNFREFHLVDYESGQWTDETISMEQYGLMTSTGEIVVDAVYDGCTVYECSDGDYIVTLYQEDSDYDGRTRQLMCNATGSWVMDIDKGVSCDFSAWEDGLIIASDYSQLDYEAQTGSPRVECYDKQGNCLFALDNCIVGSGDGFCEGYMILHFFSDFYSYEYTSRFIDKNGNIAFPEVSPCDDFRDGKAAVADSSGRCGFISTDGSWVIEPRYTEIYGYEDYYIASDGLYNIVLDSSGTPIVTTEEDVQVYGDRIYLTTDEYDEDRGTFLWQFTDALTNEPLICKETGAPVTQYFYGTDYFYCDDGSVTYIVDNRGNTLAKLEGVGNLEKIDDTYFYMLEGSWSDVTQNYTLYAFRDFQKLWGKKQRNLLGYSYCLPDGDYIINIRMSLLDALDMTPNSRFDILDIQTGKPLFEDLQRYRIFSLEGRTYLFVSDECYTYGYTPEMDLLIKVRNQATD